MRSLLACAAALVAVVAVVGCSSAADEDDSSAAGSAPLEGVTCNGRNVALHVRADTYFPRPDEYTGKTRFNGCWRFERPVQARWGSCDTKAPIIKRRPSGGRWYYDEIWQPRHDGSDLAAIKKCHASFGVGKGDAYAIWTGLGGFGDKACSSRGKICLPDASGKPVDISPFVDRVWLEVYNDAAMSYWRAHRSIGRPIIDITKLEDPYPTVKKFCSNEADSGRTFGVYVGPAAAGKFTKDSYRMGRLIKAMNDCTGKGTPTAKAPAASGASVSDDPPDADDPADPADPGERAEPAEPTDPPPDDPEPAAPATGATCDADGAKSCLDGDRWIECSGGTWSAPFSCSVSYPGTTCRSGYCVGQ